MDQSRFIDKKFLFIVKANNQEANHHKLLFFFLFFFKFGSWLCLLDSTSGMHSMVTKKNRELP